MKNTERLLLEIGLRPSRRGFAQSAMLLCILRDRPEIRSSSAAYALAAERLCATPGQLEHNLRMTIHEAWERGDRALLTACCPGAATPARRRRRISCSAWPHGCASASRRTSCRAAAETAKRRRAARRQRNDGWQAEAAIQPQRTVGRSAGTAAAAQAEAAAHRREAWTTGGRETDKDRRTGANRCESGSRSGIAGTESCTSAAESSRRARWKRHKGESASQAGEMITKACRAAVMAALHAFPARIAIAHGGNGPAPAQSPSQIKKRCRTGEARPLAYAQIPPR